MKNKIVIIGLGNVGTTLLYNLTLTNKDLEIVVIDNDKNKVKGNIIDLSHTLNSNKVRIGSYKDISDANIIVITSGIKYDSNRTLFLKKSHLMIKDIMDNITKTKFHGNIIVVSNPNDVMTTYIGSRYNKDKVIGCGTYLDTNRLKYYLHTLYNVDYSKIDALVIGEHGKSQAILWDKVKVNNKKIIDTLSNKDKKKIEDYTRDIANKIVSLKGHTAFGIVTCISDIIDIILTNSSKKIVVSSYDNELNIAYSYISRIIDGKVVKDKIDNKTKLLLEPSIKRITDEYNIFKNDLTIGIDLDDTITDLYQYMQEEAKKFDKEINGHGIIDNTKYLVGEKYNWNDELKDKFFRTYRKNAILKAKVRDDAIEYLKKLRRYGCKIIIITARNKKYYEDPYKFTKDWLDKKGIPYDKLIVNSVSKEEVCKNENISIFIDDMPTNCMEVAKNKNIKVFIMDNIDNICNDSNITRINNFKELFEEII